MLFKNFDFSNPDITDKFKIIGAHDDSWEFYYESYNYALEKIIGEGLIHHYVLNSKARPILFLIRHSLEICLKYNLQRAGLEIPITHEFEILVKAFKGMQSEIPDAFKEVLDMVNFDEDGSALRYFSDKDNKPYFQLKRVEVADILKKYNSIQSHPGFEIGSISPVFNYEGRRESWDLTFHMHECRQDNHIRTQYDDVIELIIEGIITKGWDINKLYLPLLFLIRHSLELALKFNIREIQKYSKDLIKEKNVRNEHSLVTLYNIYREFLEKLDLSKMHEGTIKQLEEYKTTFKSFNERIHNLDINSRYFRFPVDKQGKPHRIDLKKVNLLEMLDIYYKIDPFITFTNDVLESEGLLFRYTEEELYGPAH